MSRGEPCQDAWLAVADERASFAAVSDGMGSRPKAREGARAATRAARDAWRAWRRSPVGLAEDFVRLLEVFWRLRLGTLAPEESCATCLCYAEDGHGRGLTVQLGDGLIARRDPAGAVHVLCGAEGEFGQTRALGTRHGLADWSVRVAPPLAPGEVLLMATDGVSEDLLPARLGDLMDWLVDEIARAPRPGDALARELRAWPVPKHQDDKTLLVMWKD